MMGNNPWSEVPRCSHCGSEKLYLRGRCEPCAAHWAQFGTERPLTVRRRTRFTPHEYPSWIDQEAAKAWPGEGQNWPSRGWLGIDVGYFFPAVDSDGRIYRWHRRKDKLEFGDQRSAGPVRITRPDGTTQRRDPYDESQLLDVFARARDEEYRRRVNQLAARIVKGASESDRGLALEDWRDFRRRRAPWVQVWQSIRNVSKERGVVVVTVKAAYTSQTCPACGHCEKANRPDRDSFVCVACRFSGQADRIAATNIRARAEQGETTTRKDSECCNPACVRPVWKAGACLPCYFYNRRNGFYPDALTIERLASRRSAREFTEALAS